MQLNVLINFRTRDHILDYVMPVGEDPLSCKRVKVFLKGEVQQAEKLASLHDEGKGFLYGHQIL